MDEYKRVLREWAAKYIPPDAAVTSVDVSYDDGYDGTYGDYSPSFTVDVTFRFPGATVSFSRRLYGEDGIDTSLGGLLTTLFQIAEKGDR